MGLARGCYRGVTGSDYVGIDAVTRCMQYADYVDGVVVDGEVGFP